MIPIAKDTATLIGSWAERVDNPGLLHDKFPLPKAWGQGPGVRLGDAGRWNILRIVTRGADLLQEDVRRLRREASGRNTRPDVAERKEREAGIAEDMARIAPRDSELSRAWHSKAESFLKELEQSYPKRVLTFEATLGSRLMINLAGGVVENAGMALDRCFGQPFIPGSAVKGIARSQALWEIRAAQEPEKEKLLRDAMILFGYGAHDLKGKGDFAWAGGPAAATRVSQELRAEDFRGCACFLPAYPTTQAVLVVDMVNPHYPEYYKGKRSKATDDESPIPNYFPAVEAGSSFGFAAILNRLPAPEGVEEAALLARLRHWIERAVTRKGAGAKTSAGYGWFELGRNSVPRPVARAASAAPASQSRLAPTKPVAPPPAHPLIGKWQGRLNTKDNFPAALPELLALSDNAELRLVFEGVIPAPERAKLRKGNPYWQAFTSGRNEVTGKKILDRLGLKLS